MGRVRLRVYGGVQGVGFRAFTRLAAQHIGIHAGFVRNHPDGSVEVEAEAADDEALEHFRQRVSRGPTYARVQRVDDLAPSALPLPSPFAILR